MTDCQPGRIAILGAGASSRMAGGDKLLEPVDGEPLLRVLGRRALATGWAVSVTLPPDRPARDTALEGLGVTRVRVTDAATGMAASFRALAQSRGPLMVVLGDMPEIGTAELVALIEAHRADPQSVIRAFSEDGQPGQPVLFPARLVPAMARLTGDAGAKALLVGEEVIEVPLPGQAALIDLDTPEDWARWRAGLPLDL